MLAVIASRRNESRGAQQRQLVIDVKCILSQKHQSRRAQGVTTCKLNMQGWKKKRRTRNQRRAQRSMSVDRQWEA
jgi:hypothetical protein